MLYFLNQHSFAGFFAAFLVLFITTGIGNASTFRMIPVIFLNQMLAAGAGQGSRGRHRRAPRGQQGSQRHPRLQFGDRRLWRIHHSHRLRQRHQERFAADGAGSVPGFLRHLPRADVVVLLSQERRGALLKQLPIAMNGTNRPHCGSRRRIGRSSATCPRVEQVADDSAKRNTILTLSTIAFTLMFAVWLMFGVLGIPIRKEFGLTEVQFGWLTAIAILNGSIWRLLFGIWTDRFGGRLVLTLLVGATAIPPFSSASRSRSTNC